MITTKLAPAMPACHVGKCVAAFYQIVDAEAQETPVSLRIEQKT
jgi:hypothetical protein